MVKRTRKEFHDYNAYRDRPFGLKWQTAYAMEELVKAIDDNHLAESHENIAKKQMSQEAISAILFEAYCAHKPVIIQRNQRDTWGRLIDDIDGYFQGEMDKEHIMIDGQLVAYDEIRHIAILPIEKWYRIHC